MLSHDEIQLYSRHLGIPLWGAAAQEKLKKSKVFVAGAGGLGSSVLYYLAAAGIGNLLLCDYDRIDISNLNRQILHRYDRIGMPKVESAQASLREFNPFISITPINKKISIKNAGDLVAGSDLIIDCLDNFKTRHILNRVSVRFHIPMIHAGVSEFRGQMTFLNPPETPCLACFMPEDKKKRINFIAGATPGVIGSLQALEAIKYLAGIGTTLQNKMLFWDGSSMEFETISLKRNPRCRVCKNL
jgi:molybdopterin/thiamine biosynthesis adenylyltransferase